MVPPLLPPPTSPSSLHIPHDVTPSPTLPSHLSNPPPIQSPGYNNTLDESVQESTEFDDTVEEEQNCDDRLGASPLPTNNFSTKHPSPRTPPSFPPCLDFRYDDVEVIVTPEMTFRFPSSSSPDKLALFRTFSGSTPSPLNPDAWTRLLEKHPDRILVENVVRSIREGWSVGFTGPRETSHVPPRKYDPDALNKILFEFDREVAKGRMGGPFDDFPTTGPYAYSHTSPTFLIPKSKRRPDELRRIDHLSYPPGNSINDYINKDEYSTNFTDVAKITDSILNSPMGCLVSCIDIEDAYRHLELHPADVGLFLVEVDGNIYLNYRICFGGRSFVGIFDTLTTLLVWIIDFHTTVTDVQAILDDFDLFHGSCNPDNPLLAKLHANRELSQVMQIFGELGFPLKTPKIQFPSTSFTSMGVQFDTTTRTISIPPDKITYYVESLTAIFDDVPDATTTTTTTVPTLRSLLGKLVYITSILYVGRTRLFHSFKCLRAAEKRAHDILGARSRQMKFFPGVLNTVYMSNESLHDLRWWHAVLEQMPTRLLIRRRFPTSTDDDDCIHVYTDASGWGIGGHWTDANQVTSCFSFRWNTYLPESPHSTYGELYALVIAVTLWDHRWNFKHIFWHTDCKCHISGLYKIRTQAPELLSLHDYLDLSAARGGYQYAPTWIPGETNFYADALSRNLCHEVPTTWQFCHLATTRLPDCISTKLNH